MTHIEIEDIEFIRKYALLNAYSHQGKAQIGAVIGRLLGQKPEFKSSIKEISRAVHDVVTEVNGITSEQQLMELKDKYPKLLEQKTEKENEKILPELINAEEGKVVTRFPPEPNGYPHIGHAKAAIIDETYAKMYKGKFILRFDDTNPVAEKQEYYGAIKEGLEWLGVGLDYIKNTSDDMDIIYEYAKEFISKNSAYVCKCPISKIRLNRSSGSDCSCKVNTIEVNLHEWEKMFTEYLPNDAILRFRGDIKNLNTAMRDPTLFRILDHVHPLKGDRYRVWPTYDFSVVIEDSLDGITHAMRTKEYELRDELYFAIANTLGLNRVELIEFSRLELEGSPVSKRKLRPLIDQGIVEGWDDPRLPTLAGLKRRGISPDAIRRFILSMGVTKTESVPNYDVLESFNRKIMDPIVKRYYFISNPVKLKVSNAPKLKTKLRNHPDHDLGERIIDTRGEYMIPADDASKLEEGDVFRLLELYNVKVERKTSEGIEGLFIGKEMSQRSPKIQWVNENNIKFKVLIPRPPFIDNKFDTESLGLMDGLAEESLKTVPVGSLVQFVRFGFCRIDSPGIAIMTHK